MKENTRIITAQITVIETMSNEDAELVEKSKADAEKELKTLFTNYFGADDITVKIQDFMRDKEVK